MSYAHIIGILYSYYATNRITIFEFNDRQRRIAKRWMRESNRKDISV